MLRRGDDVERVPSVIRNGVVGLHGVGVDHRKPHRVLDHQVRIGEGSIDVTPPERDLVSHVVSRGVLRLYPEESAFRPRVTLGVNQQVRCQRGICVDQRLEVGVVDPHRCGSILRLLNGFGNHDRDWFPEVAHLVDGKDRVVGNDVAEQRRDADEVRSTDNPEHAGRSQRFRVIDVDDLAMGTLRPHDRSMRHVGQGGIDAVDRPPGNFRECVTARHRTWISHRQPPLR